MISEMYEVIEYELMILGLKMVLKVGEVERTVTGLALASGLLD